jgi:hypothetical protein
VALMFFTERDLLTDMHSGPEAKRLRPWQKMDALRLKSQVAQFALACRGLQP